MKKSAMEKRTCKGPNCTAKLGINNRSGVCCKCAANHRCMVCDKVDPKRKPGVFCPKCRKLLRKINEIREWLGLNNWLPGDPKIIEIRIAKYRARAELGLPLFEE